MKKLTLEKIQERVEALIPETLIGIDDPPKGRLPGSPSSKKTSEKPPKLAKKIYKLTAANYKGIGLSAPVGLKKGSSARGPYDAFFERCKKLAPRVRIWRMDIRCKCQSWFFEITYRYYPEHSPRKRQVHQQAARV